MDEDAAYARGRADERTDVLVFVRQKAAEACYPENHAFKDLADAVEGLAHHPGPAEHVLPAAASSPFRDDAAMARFRAAHPPTAQDAEVSLRLSALEVAADTTRGEAPDEVRLLARAESCRRWLCSVDDEATYSPNECVDTRTYEDICGERG